MLAVRNIANISPLLIGRVGRLILGGDRSTNFLTVVSKVLNTAEKRDLEFSTTRKIQVLQGKTATLRSNVQLATIQ